MQEGWNGLKLGASLNAAEKKLARICRRRHLHQDRRSGGHHQRCIDEFMLKSASRSAVVMIVSLVSLGWRVGIVVAAAVPLTLAIVMVVMLLTGKALDRITLGASSSRWGCWWTTPSSSSKAWS